MSFSSFPVSCPGYSPAPDDFAPMPAHENADEMNKTAFIGLFPNLHIRQYFLIIIYYQWHDKYYKIILNSRINKKSVII